MSAVKDLKDLDFENKSFQNKVREYLKYLAEQSAMTTQYIEYLSDTLKNTDRVMFEEEHGDDLKKCLDNLSLTLRECVTSSEAVAGEIEILHDESFKRDIKINKILDNEKEGN